MPYAHAPYAHAPYAHAPYVHAPYAHAPYAHAPYVHAGLEAPGGSASYYDDDDLEVNSSQLYDYYSD